MTWLVFYPRTLWQVLRHPLGMMAYAEKEQGDTPERQYSDALSPPLFLLLSLLISHGIELELHERNTFRPGFENLFQSDQALLLLRCVIASTYSLLFASVLLRRRGLKLDRDGLRAPFFSQCYLSAPFALLLGIVGALLELPDGMAKLAGMVLFVTSLFWYLGVQVGWFRSHLAISRIRAVGLAAWVFLQAALINTAVGYFIFVI
jgi:hypothetical protein